MIKQKLLLFSFILGCAFFFTHTIVFASEPSRSVLLAEDVAPIDFEAVDPLNYGGSGNAIDIPIPVNSDVKLQLSTPGGVLTRLLQYAIPLAGMILFVMIVWGGFEMVIGSSDAKSKDAGRQRVTAAVIGFILLFAAYWIAQLVQIIFGVNFLN